MTRLPVVVLALCGLLSACATVAPQARSAASSGTHVAAEAFEGADVGAQINAALASLDGKPGTVHVSATGDLRTAVSIGVGQTVEFGPGAWSCHAAPCITIDSGSQLLGAGIFLTRLVLAPESAGPMVQSRGFDTFVGKPETELMRERQGLAGDRKFLPGVKYFRIRQLTLDGNAPAARGPANGVELYGFWYWIENVSIERFSGNGLVTEFVATGVVDPDSNDANESYFTNVKLISNGKVGWVNRGPHDSIATGLIAAYNSEWGIDVIHKEGFHSGAGLMLSNTHLYGNGGGLRTNRGANIVATTLESEANHGSGVLLRSNDNIIQGLFYANEKHGLELGDAETFTAANTLQVQVHNNRVSQVLFANSAGYSVLQGSVFAMPGQGYFTGIPNALDMVLTAGNASPKGPPQYLPGGVLLGGEGGTRSTAEPIVIRGNGKVTIDARRGPTFWVELDGNVTSSEIVNGIVGQTLTLIVAQGKAGKASFAWPSDLPAPPTLEVRPGRATVAVRVFDGTSWAPLK